MKYLVFALSLLAYSQFASAAYNDCFNHGTNGSEPAGAPRIYRIQNAGHGTYELKAVKKSAADKKLFKLIIEDVEFTTYKCWDQNKNLTGFDVELMTQVVAKAGYDYIEFVPRTWTNYVVDGKKYLSLLVDLVTGWGDAVSAGMSITDERKAIVTMIGPIYKAGKKLMGRKDNPLLAGKKSALLNLPEGSYDTLAGLSVLVQAGTIRSEFFKELAKSQPGLVEFGTVVNGQLVSSGTPNKLFVLDVEAEILETFTKNQMNSLVYGKKFDLVMIDTGSTTSLIKDGYLNRDTEIVTGNIGADPTLGFVFGLGDGVSFRKDDPRVDGFTKIIASLVRDGYVNSLVQKWFKDDNAADHSWAEAY